MYMQRYSQSKEDISPSEMYSEMGPALQFLSRLAADGLVDHSQNGLSRLIFDQKDVDALAENNGNRESIMTLYLFVQIYCDIYFP